jgi:hypothetical protein
VEEARAGRARRALAGGGDELFERAHRTGSVLRQPAVETWIARRPDRRLVDAGEEGLRLAFDQPQRGEE